VDSRGVLRGPPNLNINLFLKLGDAFGNPVGKAPAGAFVQASGGTCGCAAKLASAAG
jgi:hypothetical protein